MTPKKHSRDSVRPVRFMRYLIAPAVLLAACTAYGTLNTHRPEPALNTSTPDPTSAVSPAAPSMKKSAADFLAALGPDLVKKATYPFNSEERFDWHYIPRDRKGVCYKEMSTEQQKAAQDLLRSGLSQKAIERTETIRHLENVLKAIEKGTGPVRDPDLYYFTVFGEPSDTGAWGWRYEGHHVSLNFTVKDGKVIAGTPMFYGANPAEVREGPMKGTRALAPEEDLGRALVKALDGTKRTEAVINTVAPADIITGHDRQAAIQEDKGLAYKSMSKEQQGMLLALIQQYASLQAPNMAKARLDKLRSAGLDAIKFAWMGGLEKGEKHYYRVQGPTFLIEYDNTQNDGNHVHAVWRDFKGDWGADLLEMHYLASNHADPHDH